MYHRISRMLLLALVFLTTRGSAQIFQKGDRVAFLGNSITNNGLYYNLVNLYYATRYPDRPVEFFNCGLSGDVTGGMLKRLNNDVLYLRPDWVVLMAGMNDVSRGSYSATRRQEPGIRERQQGALQTYYQNMNTLLRRLDSAQCRVILQAPTIYDERSGSLTENLTGVNQALKACRNFVQTTAAQHQLGFVDHWTLLDKVNADLWEKSKLSLINPDRVHPSPAGHLVMAYAFLKAGHGNRYVSQIRIRTGARKSNQASSGARVRALKKRGDEIIFYCQEAALPFPIMPDVRPALELVPFIDEFNQEVLEVAALPAGLYELSIDGVAIGQFSNTDLQSGINLAMLTNTPQYEQALKVMKLCLQKRDADLAIRNIRNFQSFHLPDSLWNAPPESQRRFMAMRIGRQTDTVQQRNYTQQFSRYLLSKPGEQAWVNKRQMLADSIYQVNRPAEHLFHLKPLKN